MKDKIKTITKFLFLDLALLLAISIFFALPWGFKNYPLQFHWNVFFVITADTSGADSGTGLSIFLGFVLPTMVTFAIYKSLSLLLIKDKSKLFKFHTIITFSLLSLSLLLFIFTTKIWKYFEISKKVLGKAEKSEFYEQNFISEEEFKVLPPENKRNLIYIFMESMESSFTTEEKGGVLDQDLIPNLRLIAEENINFGDQEKLTGGINLPGTSWTVAGILSKTSGLPYFNPFKFDENKKLRCLPKLKKLGDFLYQQEYNLVFSMGSKKQFENRDTVLEEQHFEIHDIDWYKLNGWLAPDYEVFWGFEDEKLYNFAKKELTELSKASKPFAYGFITVDTHFPDGYTCSLCQNEHKEKIENVILCADRQIKEFLDWAKTQDWYENTTIVITGDHNYLDAPLNNFIYRNSKLSHKEINKDRRFLDIFINSVPKKDTVYSNRTFSSFDMLPTILESMGNKIEGKGIYLGRSLFAEEKTLTEKYNQEILEKEIMKKTKKYESLK